MNADMACQQNKSLSGFDERRGMHLLAPGDVIRYRDDIFNVTGVYLSTEHRFSTVSVTMPAYDRNRELQLPLKLVEGACEIYLRASKTRF